MCAGMLPVNQSFGAGMDPILLDNVTCDQSHLELLQCVHPKDIGVHDCDQENAVGVICPYVSDASTITSTAAVTTFKHSSKHYIRNYLRSYSSKNVSSSTVTLLSTNIINRTLLPCTHAQG